MRHCARTWKLLEVLPSGTVTGHDDIKITGFVSVFVVDTGVWDGYFFTVAVTVYVKFIDEGVGVVTISNPPLGAALVNVTVHRMDCPGVRAAGHVTDLICALEF